MRIGVCIDNLTSVDIVEIVTIGGQILVVSEKFFRHNLAFNPYTDFIHDFIAKQNLFKEQVKDLLQTLAKNYPIEFMVVILEKTYVRYVSNTDV